jgi:hypothetical protein
MTTTMRSRREFMNNVLIIRTLKMQETNKLLACLPIKSGGVGLPWGKMDCASLACLCQLATTQTDKQKI